jgi:DnaJ-class molecular chaperone
MATLFIFLFFFAVGYVARCALRPWKPCPHCQGTGRVVSRTGRGGHLCHRCDATGLRLRSGRKAWNTYRRLTRDA